jgi:hypothetical protein
MPKSKREYPPSFRDALKVTTVEDISFLKTSVLGHFDLKDKKAGFRPIKVAGVSIPSTIKVSYVEGCDAKGKYWYVISWAGTNKEQPNEYELNSEVEAKIAVLEELKKYI